MRVLVIDDDEMCRLVYDHALKDGQHEVVLAPNGAVGLWEYLRAPASFDVVILDIMMPKVTGEDFLRVAGALVEHEQLPQREHVIVTTAVSSLKALRQFLDHPLVHAVCEKPIDLAQLRSLVDHAPVVGAEKKLYSTV